MLVWGTELNVFGEHSPQSLLPGFLYGGGGEESVFSVLKSTYETKIWWSPAEDFTGLPSSSGEAYLPNSAADKLPVSANRPSSPPGQRASDPPTVQGHRGGMTQPGYLPQGETGIPNLPTFVPLSLPSA